MEWKERAVMLRDLRKLDGDELLSLMGLSRRGGTDWIAPMLGGLGVGLVLGAGLGLLFAPKPGQRLREELGRKLQSQAEALKFQGPKGAVQSLENRDA
jgi:hypothetical protein